jgi:hypothetical protein
METAVGNVIGEPGCSASVVLAQLDRVLASPQFRNSKRCQALLRFVTECVLENQPDELREKIIGFRVFGREVAYDTGHDAIVRNVATEVRKRLAQYYLEEGHEFELRIEFPPGSYVPSFAPARKSTDPSIRQSVVGAPSTPRRTRGHLYKVAFGVSLCVLLAAVAGYRIYLGSVTSFDRFWAPVFAANTPVLIVVGQPVRSYRFIGPRQLDLEAIFTGPKAKPGTSLHPLIGPDEIRWNADRYLYIRDAFAMTNLSALVQAKGKKFRLLLDSSTTYSELRGSPVIAIGAFNNTWAQRLSNGTRFSLSRKVVDGEAYNCVEDRNEPNAKKWLILRNQSPAVSDDYAIVTRVVDSSTEQTVVLVAGIQDAGTQAASEFVSEPAYMNAALQNAPKGWEHHNIQLVLHTKMIAGIPGPATVVAMHFW